MVGTMVKDGDRWLEDNWKALNSIDYPKKKLRLVVEFGKSNDNSLELLKRFAKENKIKVDVYAEPRDKDLKLGGAQAAASIYNEWKRLMKDDEDYFLLFDSDVIDVPKNLIKELLKVDADIVAPYPWCEDGHFYDNWIFRINNIRFSPKDPPGMGKLYPIEVDSVGTVFLAKREPFLTVPIINPYPNLTFCINARRFGYQVVALPYLEVTHKDIAKLGLIHNPLPQNLGGYPSSNEFLTSTFPVKEYKKKSKNEVKTKLEVALAFVEESISREAIRRYNNIPQYKEKSKRWAYNKTHFDTFWCTRNLWLLHLMYKTEMYPSYIEIEISNKCPFACLHCEHPYWNQEERLMTMDEFELIMNNFPTLKEMAFTGIGDPWMNPIFMDAVKFVADRDVFIEMYDTFQHFTNDSAEKFVKWKVDKLFVSLDAATKETYEKTRVGHKWNRMLKGIELLYKYKKEYNSSYPQINFHYVIDKNNVHEALDALDFVDSLGIDFGTVMYSRLLHNFKEIDDIYLEVPENLQSKILSKAKDMNMRVSWNADMPKLLPPLRTCTALWMPFFFVTGEVITCCCQHEQNRRDWEKDMSMGNIFDIKDFKKIWYGDKYRFVRDTLYQERLPEPCIDCPIQAWQNHKVRKLV